MELKKLIQKLDQYLDIGRFKDYGPNGLQVVGNQTISKVAIGVSANMEFFERAVQWGAECCVVHHGIFWDFHPRILKGVLKARVKFLLQHDVSLLAYHLPLDAHSQVGNNVISARALGLIKLKRFGEYKGNLIGYWGECSPILASAFKKKADKYFSSTCLMYDYGPKKIQSVGIISGAAQSEFQQAIDLDLDCYITGEVSEHTMHLAKEAKKHFIAVGHYAGERVGIQALGQYIEKKFPVQVRFIDVPVLV